MPKPYKHVKLLETEMFEMKSQGKTKRIILRGSPFRDKITIRMKFKRLKDAAT